MQKTPNQPNFWQKKQKTKNRRQTFGLEFITLSMIAFNGSGYADYEDVDSFIDSYIAYNQWKTRPRQVELANRWRHDLRPTMIEFLATTNGASRQPTPEKLAKFAEFYPPAANW